MPCRPFVSEGGVVGITCGPGAYRHLVMAACPWCCLGQAQTVHAYREVYGGWCSPDLVCGSCGQYYSEDYGVMREEKRDKNVEMVKEMQAVGIAVGPVPVPRALDPEESG